MNNIDCINVFLQSSLLATLLTEGVYLDIRRLKIDLIMTYKILFGLTCLRSEQFFQLGPVRTTRGHQYKLFMPNITSDIRKYFFCSRVLQAWNDLPYDTDFTNLSHFKTALEKVNLSKYCIELTI